jgi:FlaA1/EpsC-like NDP-sugar epimerase
MQLPRRSLVAVLHDVVMAAISLPLVLYMRLGAREWRMVEPHFVRDFTIFMFCFTICLFLFRLQREVWRYVSINELRTLAKVVTVSIILTYAILFFLHRLEGIPRSVPMLQWLVLGALLSIPRVLYRMIRESNTARAPRNQPRINVLLAGANDHAEGFIRAVQRRRDMPYSVVAIVDEKHLRHGRSLRGVPILSDIAHVEGVIAALEREGKKPQRLILTDDYTGTEMAERLLKVCAAQGIGLARLPKITDFQEGMQADMRPIAIEDLLGRPQTHHDTDAMQRLIEGKSVLVTGAGGSIGSELVRQIAAFAPKQLILLEQSEYALYLIEKEVRLLAPEVALLPLIADVRNADHITLLFSRTHPNIVFHAAALKHVPLAEINPEETILTNVMGTENVARAAIACGAEAMVLVSTDKAVHPANVMGASKRLAEYVCAEASRHAGKTRIVMVRFGNVLGSTGSVVPLFQEQLARGGPLTVTHPEMERYFMTIREASGLVIQAAALAESSNVLYILDMGAPVKIVHLAEQMIRLAGYRPYDDVAITMTGLRAGEKLSEELVYGDEPLQETSHPRIRRCEPRDNPAFRADALLALYDACTRHDADRAVAVLSALVPEFHHADMSIAS